MATRAPLTLIDSFTHPLRRASKAALAKTAILILVLFAAPAVFAQTPIGHVLDIEGDWYLYTKGPDSDVSQKLAKWQDVPAGGIIRIKAPTADDHISIVDTHLNILAFKKCSGQNSCYQPIFLPNDANTSGVTAEMSSLVTEAWNLLWGEPYKSSLFRSRGVAPVLEEGVAPIANGEVDLSAFGSQLPKGTYSLVAFPRQSRKGASADPISFDWNPDARTSISIGDRTPGLYEISLVNAADQSSSPANISLRLLLCSPADYPAASSSFQRVQASSAQWKEAADAETVHQFLRAYLAEAAGIKMETAKR